MMRIVSKLFFIINKNPDKEKQTMKQSMVLISLFIMTLAITVIPAAADDTRIGTLTLHITGFDSSKGVAKIALVNSKANFNEETPFKGYTLTIINNQVMKAIHLPYGEYAIKIFHDENGNDILDTRIFGIPAERYGFSNNARGSFGPPDYENAAFKLDSPEKEMTITIN